ncbi:MAG: adenylyltransferase/cytidyltransferase family protein [Acidimicrobiia bacterium]|nr:adenylyltransferase/cytidyltransferase family protein [Acidimicrobiia bacterium]
MDKATATIVSGFFSPLHAGHLDMIEAAAELGDKLIVIVNNNDQQVAKKGKLIMDEQIRLRIIRALRVVDEALIAVDEDRTVSASLKLVAEKYGDEYRLVFANGGDRASGKVVPETSVCEEHGIEMVFGVGGNEKVDSSTRINLLLGVETEPSASPSETT